jgi:hypothetical protein
MSLERAKERQWTQAPQYLNFLRSTQESGNGYHSNACVPTCLSLRRNGVGNGGFPKMAGLFCSSDEEVPPTANPFKSMGTIIAMSEEHRLQSKRITEKKMEDTNEARRTVYNLNATYLHHVKAEPTSNRTRRLRRRPCCILAPRL